MVEITLTFNLFSFRVLDYARLFVISNSYLKLLNSMLLNWGTIYNILQSVIYRQVLKK